MISGRYERLDFDSPGILDAVRREITKRRKSVKIIRSEESKMKPKHIQVAIRIVGEGLEGKMKGKTVYQMHDSIEIGDAQPDEVTSIVRRAIETASTKK